MFRQVLPLVLAIGVSASSAFSQDAQAAPAPQVHPPASAPPTAPAVPVATVPPGQWVYTGQYGWLWLPYGQAFTYVSPGADVAYVYAYYPAVGWEWLYSPWVVGLGPWPHWGPHGPIRFAWYAHPWFHAARGYGDWSHYGGAFRAHAGGHFGAGFGGGHAFHGGGRGGRR